MSQLYVPLSIMFVSISAATKSTYHSIHGVLMLLEIERSTAGAVLTYARRPIGIILKANWKNAEQPNAISFVLLRAWNVICKMSKINFHSSNTVKQNPVPACVGSSCFKNAIHFAHFRKGYGCCANLPTVSNPPRSFNPTVIP